MYFFTFWKHTAPLLYMHQTLFYLDPIGSFIFYQLYLPKFSVLPTRRVYEFCVDLRTHSDISPIQH